jgi:molybdenum cofactor cytidylyltransferase
MDLMTPRPPLPPTLCAVLLAAGGGTRFHGDRHKLLAELDGVAIWRHAADAAAAAGFINLVVVTGAIDLEPTSAERDRFRFVHNPDWRSGQASSVLAGIDMARTLDAEFVVIGLADQPFITPEAWRAVALADPDATIVVASYDGVRGPNPVRLASDIWHLLPKEGDRGARDVIRAHPGSVLDIECVGSSADVDTLEDLARWKSF